MDDKMIINGLLLDEEKGYIMMIEKYTSYVSAIVYGMTKDILPYNDMEELVADVFFKVWGRRNTLTGDSLKGLIAQTSRNTCIDAFRKQKRAFLPLEEDILQKTKRDTVYDLSERKEQIGIVTNAVKGFGEPDKEIFMRFYYFGETIRNISEKLEINLSTVKTKLRRTREKLKEILNERGYNYE